MSYTFNNPCLNCLKRKECKDAEKIREGINHIHMDSDDTHKGAGEVLLMCIRMRPEND